MRISQLSQRTGVSVHRLRRYESDGLLQATRTAGGYRDYPEHALREVTFIAMGRQMGFSLASLAELLPRYRAGTLTIDEMIERLKLRISEIDALIAAHRVLRKRLVEHIGWFEARRRNAARAGSRDSRPSNTSEGFKR